MKMHLAVRIGISLGWVSWMAAPQLAFPAGSPPAARADLESSAVATPAVEIKGPAEQRAVAQAHYLTARSLEASGKQREALSHYQSFLSGDAGEPDLVAHIAELTLNYRGEDAAMELLEKGVKAHPDSPDPLGNLIQFCLTHGNAQNGLLQRAARTADQALKAFPDHAANYTAVVKLHLSQGQRDEAGKMLDSAFHKAKGDASFWLELARMAQEVWPLADQENRQAHVALNNAYMVRARDSANVAKDQAALIQIADYFLFSNQLDQAASICEALTAGPHGLEARKRLVRLYEAMERPDDSFKALQDLVTAYPKDVEHRRLLAGQYVQKQEIGKAADQMEAVLQVGGGDLSDYLTVCKLLRFAQNPERFEKFTQRAQQLYPGEPRITYHRAIAMNTAKKPADAAKLFEQASKQAETTAAELLDDQFYFNWGTALERAKQFDAAARQFEKSITLTPAHDPPRAANTMNYLGYMWLEQSQHLDKAEELIRKANELEQNNPAFVDSLGWLLFKQGKTKEGLAELLRAEHLMKEFTDAGADAEILDHIAQTYDQLGQKDDAKAYWKRVLEMAAEPGAEAARERAQKALGIQPPPAEKKAPTDSE